MKPEADKYDRHEDPYRWAPREWTQEQLVATLRRLHADLQPGMARWWGYANQLLSTLIEAADRIELLKGRPNNICTDEKLIWRIRGYRANFLADRGSWDNFEQELIELARRAADRIAEPNKTNLDQEWTARLR